MKKLIAVMVTLFVSAGLMFSAATNSVAKETGKKAPATASVAEPMKDKGTNAASVTPAKNKKAKKVKKVKKTEVVK